MTVHSDVDLTGFNIDKDLLKSLLPQNLSKNQDFKTPLDPKTTTVSNKEEYSISTPCSLPRLSIFPSQIYPFSSGMYSNQMINPILMQSNNFPSVSTSLSSSNNYSQNCVRQESLPNEQFKDSTAASEA